MTVTRAARTIRIAEVLSKGHCAICTALREFETSTVEAWASENVSDLCNSHAWLMAKGAPSDVTARIFLKLLNSQFGSSSEVPGAHCEVCDQLRDEEVARLREMKTELERKKTQDWMVAHGSLCIMHARKLTGELSDELQALIAKVVTRDRGQLEEELKNLLTHLQRGDRTGWGVLGRAAEFLTAQRGIAR